MNFKNELIENITLNEESEYMLAIQILEDIEAEILNEGIFDRLSGGVKNKIDFIKEISNKVSQYSMTDLLVIFKDSRVFDFFKAIKFSFEYLFKLIKTGFKAYKNLEKAVTQFISDNRIIRWTKDKLEILDNFLQEHSLLKKISGVAVAGILIFIWLNMSYSPDLEYSMDWSDIIGALVGNYSIADLFASEAGIKMLLLLATGVLLGLSFPWPGPQSIHMIGGIIYGLYKTLKIKGIKIQIPRM